MLDHLLQPVLSLEASSGVNNSTQVENQASCKVSHLRTDNGGKFTSFEDFLASKGIQRQTTKPYSPQQNGVVERKNQTVKEMARSLLHHASLPPSFWGEAFTLVEITV